MIVVCFLLNANVARAESDEEAAAEIVIAVASGGVNFAFVPEMLRGHVVSYASISDKEAEVLGRCRVYPPGLSAMELGALAALHCWPNRVTGLLDQSKQELAGPAGIAHALWRELKAIDNVMDGDLEAMDAVISKLKRLFENLSGQFISSFLSKLAHFSNLLACEKELYRSIDNRSRSAILSAGQRSDYVAMDLLKSSLTLFSGLQNVTLIPEISSIIHQRLNFLRHGQRTAVDVLSDMQNFIEPRAFPFLSIFMLRSAERFKISSPEIALIFAVRCLEFYCVGILIANGFSVLKDGRLSKNGVRLSGAGTVWKEASSIVAGEERSELDPTRKQKLQLWAHLSWEIECILNTRNQSVFGHGIIRTSQHIAETAIVTVTKLLNAREGSRATTAQEYQLLRTWSAPALKTVLSEVIKKPEDFLPSFHH